METRHAFLRSAGLCCLLLALASPARADVAGFEQLTDVTVKCPTVDRAVPEVFDKYQVCPYVNVQCEILEKGESVFKGFVTVDCEKHDDKPCADINACAKEHMRDVVAESVRQRNDPNNDKGRQDGHLSPVSAEEKLVTPKKVR